jgi:methionyl-tRNA formyltransferase
MMQKSLRVVFMGTPGFAAHQLLAIHNSPHKVVGVVTTPDKPAGRGLKIWESEVKKTATELGLPVMQPEKLRDADFIAQLQQLDADVFVVVAFRMLPAAVWQMPPLGTFNLHASLLPHYRGAAPINWAIINGEVETGNTTFLIDDKIDTGHVLLQNTVAIAPTDTAGTLHDKLMTTGGPLIVNTLDGLAAGTLKPQPQTATGSLKEAPKIFKETCRIDWTQPAAQVINHIRGLSPYPTAWSQLVLDGQLLEPVKIYGAGLDASAPHLASGAALIAGKKLFVGTGDQAICIQQLQLPGKKMVDATSFLNGLRGATMVWL